MVEKARRRGYMGESFLKDRSAGLGLGFLLGFGLSMIRVRCPLFCLYLHEG